jgi:signal transduction histidine kinase
MATSYSKVASHLVMSAWRWSATRRSATQARAGEDLLRSLSLIAEPNALRASIAGRIRELTGCDAVVLCTLRPELDAYAAISSLAAADRSEPEVVFKVSGTLAHWLRANQEPMLLPHPGGAFEYLVQEEQQVLSAVGARGCVPVFSGVQLSGILLICAHRPDWRLSSNDMGLLLTLGRQVGLALENAELHQIERDRFKNLHRAEQLAVAGQLAATVAHEIRNPLAAIRCTVQHVLQSKTDWESKRGLLEETLGEIDRIERTISGVLALSRDRSLEFVELDLAATVEQSLLVTQAYAQAHGVVVERQFEGNALPILGDRRSLHQLFVNLVMNACQAMPDGGRLTLRCSAWHSQSAGRPLALFQIRDTGHGISPEHLNRVFDPFFTTKETGTGLGLPICLDIVTRHGGNLQLESVERRGTVATVSLPLRKI